MLDSTITRLARWLRIEGLDAKENRTAAQWGLGIAAAAMFARTIFWVYTQRYWEDALITCLHSENFVLGLGMTHVRPGEPPLHGFTSPLSVLVPLVGDLMHVGWGVDFIKLVSIFAAGATVLYLVGIGIHPDVRLPAPLTLMVAGYAAFDHQNILFGMAGMETQIAVLVIIASLYHAIAWHPARLGIWLGLCMLGRPDFAFWCAILGLYGLFRDWRRMPIVVGLALVLYLPWIAFTLYEYGSPFPHTMLAKKLGTVTWQEKLPQFNVWLYAYNISFGLRRTIFVGLEPAFGGHGNTPKPIFWQGDTQPAISLIVSLFIPVGIGRILWKQQRALWPLVLAFFVYTIYYALFVPVVAGWYKPFYLVLSLLLVASGMQWVASLLPDLKIRTRTLYAIAVTYVALFVCVLPYTFYAEHQIQKYIENGVRKPAGLYLRDRMKPDEAVGCEPLGYMGYYSRGNVYDWPGLDSRKVVAWSKSVPKTDRNLEHMLKALQPEYLYLREAELMNFSDKQWFVDRYEPIKQFAVAKEDLAKIPWIELSVDTSFWILQKKHVATPPDH